MSDKSIAYCEQEDNIVNAYNKDGENLCWHTGTLIKHTKNTVTIREGWYEDGQYLTTDTCSVYNVDGIMVGRVTIPIVRTIVEPEIEYTEPNIQSSSNSSEENDSFLFWCVVAGVLLLGIFSQYLC